MTRIAFLLLAFSSIILTHGESAAQTPGQTRLIEACWLGNLDSVKAVPLVDPTPGLARGSIYATTGRKIDPSKADVNGDGNDGVTPLAIAAYRGNLGIVKYLIERGAEPNAATNSKVTALHLAAQEGHRDIVQFLLDNGADFEAMTAEGQTAFALAIQEGSADVVKMMFELQQNGKTDEVFDVTDRQESSLLHLAVAKKDVALMKKILPHYSKVGSQDACRNTPLHIAAINGDIPAMAELIAHEANVDIQNTARNTPLLCALIDSNVQAAMYLIEHGADVDLVNMSYNTALHYAASLGNVELVKALLSKEADINAKNSFSATPLLWAVVDSQPGIAALLLESDADPNISNDLNNTPLHLATKHGSTDLVSSLLSRGAEVGAKNKDGDTPLLIAADRGNVAIFNLLLNADKSALEHNETALHAAARSGNTEIVKQCLDGGLDVNGTDENGWTPLHYASREGRMDVLRLLIEKGANVNARHSEFVTPLFLASREGHPSIVTYLVKSGATVNSDEVNVHPLGIAAMNGNIETAELLIQKGANVNARDRFGFTPLHYAALQSFADVIRLLLDNGAAVDLETKDGQTVYDLVFSSLTYVSDDTLLQVQRFERAKISSGILMSHLRNRTDLTKKLLDEDAPLLHLAVLRGDSAFTRQLAASGVDMNQRYTATKTFLGVVKYGGGLMGVLHHAIFGLGYEIKTEKGGEFTPLALASASGNASIMNLLLNNGADANRSSGNNRTPLILAVKSGNRQAVTLLLSHGANEEATDSEGKNALHYAVRFGLEDIARDLLERGRADVNHSADRGVTPLHLAATSGNLSIVSLLVLKGGLQSEMSIKCREKDIPDVRAGDVTAGVAVLAAALEKTTSGKWKPIHLAARHGHLAVVKYLLEHGENLTASTDDGITPVIAACNSNNPELVKFLQGYSGQRFFNVRITTDARNSNLCGDEVRFVLSSSECPPWRPSGTASAALAKSESADLGLDF